MHDILSVAMIDRLEELFHITCGLRLIESSVRLLDDAVEQSLAGDVLHHQVDVLLVVVSLVVLNDVGVIEGVQDGDLLDYAVNVFLELIFVQHLNGDLLIRVMNFVGQENARKCAFADNFRLRVDPVVAAQLSHTLLLESLSYLVCLLLYELGIATATFVDSLRHRLPLYVRGDLLHLADPFLNHNLVFVEELADDTIINDFAAVELGK